MKMSKILKNHTVWIDSDFHAGHANILNFHDQHGRPLRPWTDIIHMENDMIDSWNARVNPNDYIIHGGDFAMNKTGYDRVIHRLNGRKILILGNHDTFNTGEYLNHFEHVLSMLTVGGDVIITHIPIHPASLERWGLNVHGHLHSNSVLLPDGNPDLRYVCVSTEQHDFQPVLLNDVIHDAKIRLYGTVDNTGRKS